MRLALIADSFPPLRNSGAIQIMDLSREFRKKGHEITVIVPSAKISKSWLLENIDEVRVLRLRAPKIKDINYFQRTFAEFLMPFFMLRNLLKSPLAYEQWDGVVWYSPSIFHGPLVRYIKNKSKCKSYLIIRDIFPQWAADIGLLRKGGLVYLFFNIVAKFQYSVADIIGVQSEGNLIYFKNWVMYKNRKLEVLQNWLSDSPVTKCSILLGKTRLKDREIFVYAGNMGVAQNLEDFIYLAKSLKKNLDIGFLFVGRGNYVKKLTDYVNLYKLDNILFFNEIPPEDIPALYSQCSFGIISLNSEHSSHNIPGKFLSYMRAGLPVLAKINSNNDLAEIIYRNNVGKVFKGNDLESFKEFVINFIKSITADKQINERCRNLYLKQFSTKKAVIQILNAFKS